MKDLRPFRFVRADRRPPGLKIDNGGGTAKKFSGECERHWMRGELEHVRRGDEVRNSMMFLRPSFADRTRSQMVCELLNLGLSEQVGHIDETSLGQRPSQRR